MRRKGTVAFRVRRMQESDVPQVEALEWRLFPDPWPAGSFLHEVHNPFADVWVAVLQEGPEEGPVIGYLVMWRYEKDAQIANIAVAPEWQGRGVGTALLNQAIATARRLGMATISLEVRVSNRRAYAWYLRRGFRVVRRLPGYYRVAPGRWEDGWQMVLFLHPSSSASPEDPASHGGATDAGNA